ncbi:hypothetical protein [Trinickia dinghuensis]|uniref:Lipoprotein n=1 Tax=Trinickia dinghuensis TaxID=2291023 RepID=A0A3D8JUT0_9BURK|nr:hypothetical protein [Trinickia dinghuensis]RDU96151.1 hypothetical protein DWV00_26005 [Trinickia dinghuensis]
MKANKLLILTLAVGTISCASLTGCIVAPVPAQVTIGWHGDRYWDGHRYWERRDWEARHHEGYDQRQQY